ncbi:MAG: hypothetical protein K2W82_15875 [Candidatus Obscuribacterales bacterium]|nr:hypothetical protein [Candidatus Obscuribacterales bacterium]
MSNQLLKPSGNQSRTPIFIDPQNLPESRTVKPNQAGLVRGILERLSKQAKKSSESWEEKYESKNPLPHSRFLGTRAWLSRAQNIQESLEENQASVPAQNKINIDYNRSDNSIKFSGNFAQANFARKQLESYLTILRCIVIKNRFLLFQLKERKRFSLCEPEAHKLGVSGIQLGNANSTLSCEIEFSGQTKAVVSNLSGITLLGKGFETPVHRIFVDLDPTKPLLSALTSNPVSRPEFVEEAHWPALIKVPILLPAEPNVAAQIIVEALSLYAEVSNILQNKR